VDKAILLYTFLSSFLLKVCHEFAYVYISCFLAVAKGCQHNATTDKSELLCFMKMCFIINLNLYTLYNANLGMPFRAKIFFSICNESAF